MHLVTWASIGIKQQTHMIDVNIDKEVNKHVSLDLIIIRLE